MPRSSTLRFGTLLAGLTLAVSPLMLSAHQDNRPCRKCKLPPAVSRIAVTVLRKDDDKPIPHAAVVFHAIEGDKDRGGLELKTNEDGVAVMDVIPIGDTVLLQVIANGYQTYGGEYKVNRADMALEIRLRRPGQQYSIYENQDTGATSKNPSGNGSQGSPNGKSSGTPKQ